MGGSQYDVVIVGGGCAGMSAAIGLAKAGFAVVVLEAAPFPGAENWSGCVYFCENLVHPSLLGPGGVEGLAWERRLVERGLFMSNGHGLLGLTYRDPPAFRHCYTVLRPIFDHHLAQLAQRAGVVLLNNTTVESLIRAPEPSAGRVIGVATNRGPVYADLVFLAEGDASHLVTREGYEHSRDPRWRPKFLHGIKQVIDLPPGAVEENFGLGAEEGAAYEVLIRNLSLRGQSVRLNMGGFVYTNRESLSIGLVLPADHLREHFGGDPNLLMEWFEALPDMQRWCHGGTRGVFGAKLIRGGGVRDLPRLVDHGLAIGGAATGIGVDLPYPNFTGPATRMGLLLVEAAKAIRRAGADFTQEELQRHYVEPLKRTRYWKDVEYLRRWPEYVERTQFFFGRNLDLVLGSAYLWTRPRSWLPHKWINWIKMLLHVAGPGRWSEIRQDVRQLRQALQVGGVVRRVSLGRMVLDGWVNALRDLFRRPRQGLHPVGSEEDTGGQVRLVYSVLNGAEPVGRPPRLARRWWTRNAPVLAAAARQVYANDDTPLEDKFRAAAQVLVRQVSVVDLLLAALAGVFALLTALGLVAREKLKKLLGRRDGGAEGVVGTYPQYVLATRRATDLTAVVPQAAQKWEDRLGRLAYQTERRSHIHLFWPQQLARKQEVVQSGLWHVCPAHVYEARVNPLGQLQVVVNFENCIKCETCWRTSDAAEGLRPLVDWARDGGQRFIYPVTSPAVEKLLDFEPEARPALPRAAEPGQSQFVELTRRLPGTASVVGSRNGANGEPGLELAELRTLLDRLDQKLSEFSAALGDEPRTLDAARADHLKMLADYAQTLAEQFTARLRELFPTTRVEAATQPHELAGAMLNRIASMLHHADRRRFAWAAGDGRHVQQHHLAGLRSCLGLAGRQPAKAIDALRLWRRPEESREAVKACLDRVGRLLDDAFPPQAWRDLEHSRQLTPQQHQALCELVALVPPTVLDGTTGAHAPLRKAILAELGRRDPSLAYRLACHLWARDLACLGRLGPESTDAWSKGERWAALVVLESGGIENGRLNGEALFVPDCDDLLVLVDARMVRLSASTEGVDREPLPTLGLRSAGLRRVRLAGVPLSAGACVECAEAHRLWQIVSAADLVSIAAGMADQLTRRAVAHAASRVQFPGLFLDEQARDPIGKFGAVKKLLAEMGARHYLLETLDHCLSPVDFSAEAAVRAGLVKALAAELLGTAPGSLSYNAGQVFGGTGYSEDDILSKYYRDASAWRFLGPENRAIWSQVGRRLQSAWAVESQRLAALPEEAERFDEIARRKALLAELEQVRAVRNRLRALGDGLASRQDLEDAGGRAEAMARQEAQLLAAKALLLRTHAQLECGLPAEESVDHVAQLRVWLQHVERSLTELEKEHAAPFVNDENTSTTWYRRYDELLQAPAEYNSGDFLCKPVDLAQPRFVPEMVQADPQLAQTDRHYCDLISGHFDHRAGDGMPYERYIESRHRPDEEDLDFCRRHGFFRMPIPTELGGEGRRKVDYYLLTNNAQRIADVSISLAIQASTSIGTTPILLARDKDLPRARKELGPFVADTALQQEIQQQLAQLLRMLEFPDPKRLQKAFLDLTRRLEETVFSRTVLKSLGHRFAEAWFYAGRAGQEFDLPTFRTRLQEAAEAWTTACARAPELLTELARRQEACDLFLRWIASGQISAFALTEPSAGSDTARVATRARLVSVPVEPESEGVYRFVPAGQKEPRRLLDARRLVRLGEGSSAATALRYRWSDDVAQHVAQDVAQHVAQDEPALIRFEEYDYETDDPRCLRYFERDGRKVYFHDIAQLRERDGGFWYDYWELTGAKMWITNGRMAGVMCLYAKTAEGVTGFLVDRHAEGLVVGKDEAKMGQNGSPTNELSLQAVRVPRENVLGLEGRGQVNALETLNVGRAGLAMSSVAQMPGLIAQSRAIALQRRRREAEGWKDGGMEGRSDKSLPSFQPSSLPDLPAGVAWRLDRMEEERFIAEAVAFEVIGRFEHKQTKSVRMESAIAKMLVSELFHSVIELAEEAHGLAGQTQLHLVEKRKRDARILNIYEGTNEVQRFLILKELVSDIAPRMGNKGEGRPKDEKQSSQPQAAGRVQELLNEFRTRLEAGIQLFGAGLWQNPNLQASCFLLSEAAAWLKAAESVAGRRAWLQQARANDSKLASQAEIDLSQRALARCEREVRLRLRAFDEQLDRLRRGYYAVEIRAAELMFHAASKAEAEPAARESRIERPLSVLVIVEPQAAGVPRPHVRGGRLLEPHLTLGDADRSALEAGLRLRDQAMAPVALRVAAVGPKAHVPLLYEVLALGFDEAILLASPTRTLAPDQAARGLAHLLRQRGEAFDIILSGAAAGGEEGLVGRLTTQLLGLAYAGECSALAVRHRTDEQALLLREPSGRRQRVRAFPAAVGVQAGLPLRPFTTTGYFAGLSKAVNVASWPGEVPVDSLGWASGSAMSMDHAETRSRSLRPAEAAELLRTEMGIESGSSPASNGHADLPIADVERPTVLEGLDALSVLACDAEGRLSAVAVQIAQTASQLARAGAQRPGVLLLACADAAGQRRAAAQLVEQAVHRIGILPAGEELAGSDELRSRLLLQEWPAFSNPPRIVLGEGWTEAAFAALALPPDAPQPLAARIRQLDPQPGGLRVQTARALGKLRTLRTLTAEPGKTLWISLAEDPELPSRGAPLREHGPDALCVQRWSPRSDHWFGRQDLQRLLDELKHETGLVRLPDAEFIIDVGYGVGNRDGYEEVILPLEQALIELGVRNLMIGGSRKVTEELHLLPADRQIGQSGQSVSPKILLAIGISGAPQHLSYIGPRATVIAFNRDPEAPIMTLNQRQPRPRVFPVVGDLFETVPSFLTALRNDRNAPTADNAALVR